MFTDRFSHSQFNTCGTIYVVPLSCAVYRVPLQSRWIDAISVPSCVCVCVCPRLFIFSTWNKYFPSAYLPLWEHRACIAVAVVRFRHRFRYFGFSSATTVSQWIRRAWYRWSRRQCAKQTNKSQGQSLESNSKDMQVFDFIHFISDSKLCVGVWCDACHSTQTGAREEISLEHLDDAFIQHTFTHYTIYWMAFHSRVPIFDGLHFSFPFSIAMDILEFSCSKK